MCNIMNLLFLCFVFLLRKPAKGWAKLFHANEVRLGGVGGRCRVWCINPSVRWGVGWAFCPLFRAMYHAANGRRWVSIPPWSARLGSGLEGVAQFSTLVLEEYFRELETVRNAKKKRFQIWQKLASRSWPQHTVAVAMHDRDCDRFCSFNGAAYVFFGLP